MNRIKYIIIASSISLLLLGIITYIINMNVNKSFVNVAMANTQIKAGAAISYNNITWIKIDSSKLDVAGYITENDITKLSKFVVNNDVLKEEIILKKDLIDIEEYLEKTEGLEYIALPIKSATEGVCYKIKKGDKISVYYTAKKKLVENILKDKKKVYSVATSESLVTCLLYENVEIIATTNNIGQDTSGQNITDIVITLSSDEALELANLKEQGTFTLTVK